MEKQKERVKYRAPRLLTNHKQNMVGPAYVREKLQEPLYVAAPATSRSIHSCVVFEHRLIIVKFRVTPGRRGGEPGGPDYCYILQSIILRQTTVASSIAPRYIISSL